MRRRGNPARRQAALHVEYDGSVREPHALRLAPGTLVTESCAASGVQDGSCGVVLSCGTFAPAPRLAHPGPYIFSAIWPAISSTRRRAVSIEAWNSMLGATSSSRTDQKVSA